MGMSITPTSLSTYTCNTLILSYELSAIHNSLFVTFIRQPTKSSTCKWNSSTNLIFSALTSPCYCHQSAEQKECRREPGPALCTWGSLHSEKNDSSKRQLPFWVWINIFIWYHKKWSKQSHLLLNNSESEFLVGKGLQTSSIGNTR